MRAERRCVVGVDFGTEAARAVVVDVLDGSEVGSAKFAYTSGKDGVISSPSDPRVARQAPGDYIKAFVGSVRGAVAEARLNEGLEANQILGIGVSAKASTPLPVDLDGVPLSFKQGFEHRLEAQAWLWKDHSAAAEAEEITDLAKRRGLYLHLCGGSYSPEWFWAKVLRAIRTAPEVANAAATWVELCDFIPAYLSENRKPGRMLRSVCAAGHKALFSEEWGGAPSEEFLRELHPGLARLREGFYRVKTMDQVAGHLREDIADEIGLPPGTPLAVGGVDAHLGAVGSGVRPGALVKMLGPSSCDIFVAPKAEGIREFLGVCGVVDGSVIPGMFGVEAGQAAVGDLYNWWVSLVDPETDRGPAHARLSAEASILVPGQSGLLALDGNNGNRSVLADPQLSGLILGQTLATSQGAIYRSLVEATAFGARRIIETLESGGAVLEQIIACGEIAQNNEFVMQIYSNVCGRAISTTRTDETCALGAAIYAAVAAGAHSDTQEAISAMTHVGLRVYAPDLSAHATYNELYALYRKVHDAFGGVSQVDLSLVMRHLRALQKKASAEQQARIRRSGLRPSESVSSLWLQKLKTGSHG